MNEIVSFLVDVVDNFVDIKRFQSLDASIPFMVFRIEKCVALNRACFHNGTIFFPSNVVIPEIEHLLSLNCAVVMEVVNKRIL